MNNHEEIIRKKEKRKKILIAVVLIVIGTFLIFGAVALILSAVQNFYQDEWRANEAERMRQSYNFYPADYAFNIFSDEGYLAMDRNVWVLTHGAVRTVITDENRGEYSPEIQFMYDVVNLIINGEYIEYNNLFTEDCFEKASQDERDLFEREEFTMQQLFEIELEAVGYTEEINLAYSDIKLIYRIRNNNGTFRRDVGPNDGARAVVYTLVTDREGEIKIDRILTHNMYGSGLY